MLIRWSIVNLFAGGIFAASRALSMMVGDGAAQNLKHPAAQVTDLGPSLQRAVDAQEGFLHHVVKLALFHPPRSVATELRFKGTPEGRAVGRALRRCTVL